MANKFTDLVKEIILEIEQEELEEMTSTGNVAGYDTPSAFTKPGSEEKKNKRLEKATGGTIVNTLDENRWIALKKDESTPRVKLAKGVSNIKKQLSEIETFLNWYSKIKNESGLTREEYWKRTNRNLHKIRERLMNISEKLRGL
jgi:hypothetical protein